MPTYRNTPVDLVLDVRSKLEYWLGHLPGAVCIPFDQLPEALDELPDVTRGSRILVYCASGGRSAAAAAALRAGGYSRVTDAGGIAEARAEFVGA